MSRAAAPAPATEAGGRPRPAPPGNRRRALGLVAGLVVLGFLGWTVVDGWSRATAYRWSFDPLLLLAAVAALAAFYVLSGWGYAAIVDRLHPAGPPRRVTLSIWARSLLGRYVPGNVLMVLGRTVMAKEAGVPRRATLAATVYEQALALGIACAGALVFLATLAEDGPGAGTIALALMLAGLVLLHPRAFGPLSSWALRRMRREPLARLLTARQVAGVAGIYLASTALLAAGVWLLVRSAAGPEAGGPLYVGLAFLFAWALSMLAVIFPSGLGVREGAFAVALSGNLPGSVAVALSIGSRLAITLVELVVVVALVVAGRRR